MFNIFRGLTAAAAESEIAETVANAAEEAADMSIKWKPDDFLPSLEIMGKGMLCIFIVIGVIIASVYLVTAVSKRLSERKEAKNNSENENQ